MGEMDILTTDVEQREPTPAVVSKDGQSLLQLQDLHVWYELKRFGFGHAGYVRAVDG
ncbi:MAG: hypothetical protein GX579_06000, partial [Chloroflexi bacterium]|nr:hypothetical protein [Chloroflexota bacterium]